MAGYSFIEVVMALNPVLQKLVDMKSNPEIDLLYEKLPIITMEDIDELSLQEVERIHNISHTLTMNLGKVEQMKKGVTRIEQSSVGAEYV